MTDMLAAGDREIARRCAVSDRFVNGIRADLTANIRSDERTYTTRHGTPAVMDTRRIGARELAAFRSKAQNLESLERKARAVGQIQDEHTRLLAAVELLTEILELSERLIGLAWLIRAEAGLKTRPE